MKNKSFQFYLVLMGLIVGALIPAISCFVLQKSENTIAAYSNISNKNLPSTRSLGTLLFRFRQIRIPVRAIPLRGNTQGQIQKYISETKQAISEFQSDLVAYKKLIHDQEQAALVGQLDSGWTQFADFGGQVLALGEKGDDASLSEAARLIRDICPEKTKMVEDTLQRIIERETFLANQATVNADATARFVRIVSYAGIIMGFLVSLTIAILFGAWMARKLNVVSESLFTSSVEVKSVTQELNQGASSLSNSSTEASRSLQEAVASIEEITSMVKLNSGRAIEAEQISALCLETAQITDQKSKALNASVKGIAESSKQIEAIVTLIDDIAFQTNLLALNAAVEAARAGEQGKGFAVVAEAVRSLAQKTASSAKEISVLVKTSVEKAQGSDLLAQDCQATLGSVVENIQKIAKINAEVASANKESSHGINQISITINQLDSATQSNASLAEQSSSTARQLAEQSNTLDAASNQLLRFLKGA